jgi:hypothetical protein
MHGNIGRRLSGLEITDVPMSKKEEGRCDLSLTGGEIRVITDSSATFVTNLVAVGDWLVVGGDIFLEHDKDRRCFYDGSVSSGFSIFEDATNSPFVSGDVNKLLIINTLSEYGIYKITTYLNSSQVSLNKTFTANRNDLTYSLLEAPGNWGIYEVSEVVSETQLEVSAVKEFVSIGDEPFQQLTYACYSPRKIKVLPGSFINNGIIVEYDSEQYVEYPAGSILPGSPPLFLVAQTQDEREASPVLLNVVVGLHSSPNSVILATSDLSYYEKKSKWSFASEQSITNVRVDVDKLLSGFGQPGCHVKQFSIEYDDVQWPPRLIVKYPERDDGWIEKDPVVGTKSQSSQIRTAPYNSDYSKYGEKILDVDLRAPVSNQQRTDRVVVSSRKNKEKIWDEAEGISISDGIGENYLSYQAGHANTYNLGLTYYAYPTKEPVSDSSYKINTFDSCAPKVVANNFGTTIFAHAEYDTGIYTMVFSKINPDVSGFAGSWLNVNPTGETIEVTCSARPTWNYAEVDGNGCFHFVWTENFSTPYYVKLDPFGNNIIQGYTAIPGVSSASNFGMRMCVSLTGVVTFIWNDTSGMSNIIKGTMFSADGQGSLTVLKSPTDLFDDGIPFVDADVTQTWDSERIIVAGMRQQSTPHEVRIKVFDNDFNLIESYTIPSVSLNTGGTVGADMLTRFVFLERNKYDEVVLFTYGTDDSFLPVYPSLLATRITNGMSKEGYMVCDQRTHNDGTIFIGSDFHGYEDGTWCCFGISWINGSPYYGSYGGYPAFVRLSSSFEMLNRTTKVNDTHVSNCVGHVSGSLVPKYGDAFILYIDSDDYNLNDDCYCIPIETEVKGSVPKVFHGFSPNKFDEQEHFSIAEIDISRGCIPVMPGIGLYLSPDPIPTTSTLSAESSFVDGEKTGGITVALGDSFGVSATVTNAHNDRKYHCIMLIDAVESDGFLNSDYPDSFVAYKSDDNSSWTQITIKEVYRVGGRTYIVISPESASYFKVRLTKTPLVPLEYSVEKNTAFKIEEIRLFDAKPKWLELNNTDNDGVSIRGVDIRFKNLPELNPIFVGDGKISFGDYVGWGGIQRALYEAQVTSGNSNIAVSHPRCSKKVIIGDGIYDVQGSLHIPGGSDVEFGENSTLLFRSGYDIPLSKTYEPIYCVGYSEFGIQVYQNHRQIKVGKNVRHYGINIGSKVKLSTSFYSRIVNISKCGRIITLADPVSLASGTEDVVIFAPYLKISGLSMESKWEASDATWRDIFVFLGIDKLLLKRFSVTDKTGAIGHEIMAINTCEEVDLDDVKISSQNASSGVSIYSCKNLKGRCVKVTADSGKAITLNGCEIDGFDGLTGDGDGSSGNDIDLTSNTGVLGRFLPVNDDGINDSSNTFDFDWFYNLRVHNNFIGDGYSIVNGNAYELMLSMVIGWVQAFHSIPWKAVPSGWVDGLVDDSVIEW